MARIRTIKPQFWEDEKVGTLPAGCKLLFIGSWSYADDYGFFKGIPTLLKSQIFPYDKDLTVETIQSWLELLVENRMLIPVEYNGNQFYLIRTFSKHQHVDKRYIQSFIDMNRVIELKNNLLNLPAERSAQEVEVEVEVDMEVEVDVEVEKENKDNANALQKETSVSSFTPEYQKFLNWIKAHVPYCSNPRNFSKQISQAQFLKLKADYTSKQIMEVLQQIENRKDLRKRYNDLYRTALNWLKRHEARQRGYGEGG